MGKWKLIKIIKLSERSKQDTHNSGQNPKKAKSVKTLLNPETGQLLDFTDLSNKKRKRTFCFDEFLKMYKKPYDLKKISILSFVIYDEKYKSISDFNSMITRKLTRKGIKKLGHVWCRDIGEINFESHSHFLVATSHIDAKLMNLLFCNKRHNDYKVEFCYNPKGLKDYLIKKELYGLNKQRSYGKSINYLLPNNPKIVN